MKQLRIKDNSNYLMQDLNGVTNLVERVLDQTLDNLEEKGLFVFPSAVKEAEDLTSDQMILRTMNNKIWSSNLMGVIGLKDENLTIGSRFTHITNDGRDEDDNDYFFNYMLEKVSGNPNIVNLNVGKNNNERIFNMLAFIFPVYLANALRKGLYKTYETRQYNDSNIKGVINVSRHIKVNTPFMGKIAYNQREFTYDNELMELIRHTIEFIKNHYHNSLIFSKVKDEVQQIIEVTQNYEVADRAKIINLNKKKVVKNLYFHEYRDLQKLCIMILQNDKHQLGAGSFDINGIIFDGAWLWEEYINTLIRDDFYHPMNKSNDGAQQLFTSIDGAKSTFGKIYPDFIGRYKDNRFIADTKYKPIDNINGRDYLQIVCYMYRFDSKNGFYIYPESGEKESKNFHLNEGVSYEKNVAPREDILIQKLGLSIPTNCDSYETFKQQIHESEIEFKKQILQEIN